MLTFKLVDRVQECYTPGMPGRLKNAIDTIIFHRIGLPCGEDAVSVAQYFKEHPDAVGVPWMPYHFIVPRQQGGTLLVEQALPLLVQAPHAWKWNRRAIGVAVVGDFRGLKPQPEQVEACVWLVRRLFDVFGKPLRTEGHTAVPESTKTPGKVCPGKWFPYKSIAKQALALGGVVLESDT